MELFGGILEQVLLIALYAFLGGAIKYIDQVYDEHIFNEKIAIALAVLSGLIMGLLVAVDNYSAMIFIAIVLGVAITRKIDNFAFYLGSFLVLAVPLVYRFFALGNFAIDFVLVSVLSIAGLLDEWGNDYVDKEGKNGIVRMFFYYRSTMKAAVAAFYFLGIFPLVYLIAFLAFDTAYMAVHVYSKKTIKGERGLFVSYT